MQGSATPIYRKAKSKRGTGSSGKAENRLTTKQRHGKRLVQEQKEQERKDRTRRLIERGAILESLIDGAETFTNEQIKLFLEKTIRTEYGKKALALIAAQDGNTTPQKPADTAQGNATAMAQTEGSGTGAAAS